MTGEVVLSIRGVSKAFRDQQVLRSVDLDVHAGEVVCLLGRSGSGKTTLLRCINHLERIDEGSIWIDGQLVGYEEWKGMHRELRERDIARMRSRIGMVFQQFNLFPHRTALENVCEGPVRVKKQPRAQVERRAREVLAKVGLAEKADSYPRQLSGGQQQRVAIARALAMEPRLILFDEPTSALDPELVAEVLAVIRKLASDGMTMVIVTHELAFADDVADRVVFIDQGEIIASGPPAEVLHKPTDARLRSFLLSYTPREAAAI